MRISKDRYLCGGYISRRSCTTATAIRRSVVEGYVQQQLIHLADQPLTADAVALWGGSTGACQQWLQGRRDYDYEMDRITGRHDRALEALIDGTIGKDEYRQIQQSLDQQQSEVRMGDPGDLPDACADIVRATMLNLSHRIHRASIHPPEVVPVRRALQEVIESVTVDNQKCIEVKFKSRSSSAQPPQSPTTRPDGLLSISPR